MSIKCAGWNIFPYKSYSSSRKSDPGKKRTRKIVKIVLNIKNGKLPVSKTLQVGIFLKKS